MTTPSLDEIARRAEAATPAPWEHDTIHVDGDYGGGPDPGNGFNGYEMHAPIAGTYRVLFSSEYSDACEIHEEYDEDGAKHAWDETARRNFEFISHAREDIPYLLSRLREAEARVERMREALEPFASRATNWEPSAHDDMQTGQYLHISLGDLRRARAALAQKEGG